ncbi:MAG: tetratricopeptide repeat protein [Bacteroidetes bacterium]|nr:MAG: tetratricopeptide repeat protein [Bacteroidota bacterium]
MKKSFWTVALAFGLASQASQAQTIAEGLRYLEQEQYGNARKALQDFYSKNQTAEGAYQLGYFYLKTEKPDSAKVLFEKGVTIDPKYPLNYVGLGRVKYMGKNVAGAKADFEQALTISKRKNAEVMLRIAEAYVYDEPKDITEALNLLEGNKTAKQKGAKDLAPQDIDVALTNGDAYLERNDMSKGDGGNAANCYDRALGINPKSAKAYIRKGNIWRRARNYKKALEDYKKGIEVDPGYSPAYRLLGDLYSQAGQYKEGIGYYEEYMKRSDGNIDTQYMYGQFLYVAKEYAKSYEVLKKLEGKLDRPNLLRLQAYNQYELKDYANGLKNLEGFVGKVEADKLISSDYEYLGRLYLVNGKDTLKAIENISKAAEVDTAKRSLYGEMFTTMWNGKAYKYAAVVKETQISKASKPSINDYMGWGQALHLAKDYKKADEVLEKANGMQETAQGVYWKARNMSAMEAEKEKTDAKDKKTDAKDKKYPASKAVFERYLEIADKEKDKKRIAEVYYRLASIEGSMNNLEKTEEFAKKSLEFDPDYKNAKEMMKQIEELKPKTPEKKTPEKK